MLPLTALMPGQYERGWDLLSSPVSQLQRALPDVVPKDQRGGNSCPTPLKSTTVCLPLLLPVRRVWTGLLSNPGHSGSGWLRACWA